MSEAKCSAPECTTLVSRPHVLCIDHFHKLPKKTRQELQSRLAGWKNLTAAQEFLAAHYRANLIGGGR